MNARYLVTVLALTVSSATSAAAQNKHDSRTASTMINGRRIFARTDKGSASIARSGGTAAISIPGHKIKVEKARVILDNQGKPIPAAVKRVEIDAVGGKVIISVDHKVVLMQGK